MKQQIWLNATPLALLAFIVLNLMAGLPLAKGIVSRAAEIHRMKSAIQSENSGTAANDQFVSADSLELKKNRLLESLPYHAVSDLIETLHDEAGKQKLTIVSISVLDEKQHEYTSEICADLRISGGFNQIGKFLRNLEQKHSVRIEHLSLEEENDSSISGGVRIRFHIASDDNLVRRDVPVRLS